MNKFGVVGIGNLMRDGGREWVIILKRKASRQEADVDRMKEQGGERSSLWELSRHDEYKTDQAENRKRNFNS
jgi:hypothetical protein